MRLVNDYGEVAVLVVVADGADNHVELMDNRDDNFLAFRKQPF
jgi:hypothetical protein